MATHLLDVNSVGRHIPTAADGKVLRDSLLRDGEGLFLRVRRLADGWQRTWMYIYKMGGTESRYIRLGDHGRRFTDRECEIFHLDPKTDPFLTLKTARICSRQLHDLQKAKVDPKTWLQNESKPIEIWPATNNEKTLRIAVDEWLASEEVCRKPAGIEEIKRIFNKDVFPAIGDRPVKEIKKADIQALIAPISERGSKRIANLCTSLLKQFFFYAEGRDLVPANPLFSARKKKRKARDRPKKRVLNEKEIRLLPKAMAEAGITWRARTGVWLALSTLARIGEISQGEWEYLDIEIWKWTIPAKHSKNELPIIITLSGFARSQFEQLLKGKENAIWMFPNRKHNGHQCVKNITRQLTDHQSTTRLGKRRRSILLRLPGGYWTAHDLRRTGATIMGALGVPPKVIERCLNHQEQTSQENVYNLYEYQDEMAAAWDLLGRRLEEILRAPTDEAALRKHSQLAWQSPFTLAGRTSPAAAPVHIAES